MEGEYISYYMNGNIFIQCYYINGKKYGICKIYNQNGTLRKLKK